MSEASDAAYEKQLSAVLKHLYAKVPKKTRKVHGRAVQYSKGEKMLETLVASPFYSEDENAAAPAFIRSSEEAVATCQELLERGHFHRGVYRDVPMFSKEKNKKIMKKTLFPDEEEHDFVAENVSFIWTYEPTSPWAWVGGGFLMLGVLLVVISPIWPDGLGFIQQYGFNICLWILGVLLGLQLVRLVLFIAIWCLSFGRCYFWIFPRINNERIALLETFWPLYSIEGREDKDKPKEKKKSKERTKKSKTATEEKEAAAGAPDAKDEKEGASGEQDKEKDEAGDEPDGNGKLKTE